MEDIITAICIYCNETFFWSRYEQKEYLYAGGGLRCTAGNNYSGYKNE